MVQKTVNTQIADSACPVASLVAGEDIRVGEYYAQMSLTCEYPSYCWPFTDPSTTRVDEPVRITYRSGVANGPYRVKAICLPFVLVKCPSGSRLLLDLRHSQLARVDIKFARQVWKAQKKDDRAANDKNKKSKKKNKTK
ncbi:MAG: hypothetical protein ACR2NP_00950 [Pirellulaceae bacterium]